MAVSCLCHLPINEAIDISIPISHCFNQVAVREPVAIHFKNQSKEFFVLSVNFAQITSSECNGILCCIAFAELPLVDFAESIDLGENVPKSHIEAAGWTALPRLTTKNSTYSIQETNCLIQTELFSKRLSG